MTPIIYGLTPGVATFGLGLPMGLAQDSVQVGNLKTQGDRKNSWPDGTWKFGAVTALVKDKSDYEIRPAASVVEPVVVPEWPTATVVFSTAGTVFTAMLPAKPNAAGWLAGSLVNESRAVVVPQSVGVGHALLQVLFDVRSYAGGGYRVDVCGQSTRDIVGANQFTYDLSITVGGRQVYSKSGAVHQWGKRWRLVFLTGGLVESEITPDFESFYAAGLIPRFLTSVSDGTYSFQGEAWDILQYGDRFGDMLSSMGQPAGRPELAPYPDPFVRYLIHKSQNLRRHMLACADLCGSWSGHVAEPNGLDIIRLDKGEQPKRGGYWFDGRWRDGGTDGPKNDGIGTGQRIDATHLYQLPYLPYMVTCDRFYVETLKFWAAQVLIQTYPGAAISTMPGVKVDFGRQGAKGLLAPYGNEPRGFGWGLETVASAAVATPDADPDKSYFVERVQNNLDWLDVYTRTTDGGFLPAVFSENTPSNWNRPVWSSWQCTILANAVDFCRMWGFGPTKAFRDRNVMGQINTMSHPAIMSQQVGAALYYPFVGYPDGSLFKNLAEFAAAQNPSSGFVIGYYGANIRILIMMGVRDGLPGADIAWQWIQTFKQPGSGMTILDDINQRPGWALAPFGSIQPEPAPGPVPVPIPEPPAPPLGTTKVLTATIKGSQNEANANPATLTNTLLITVVTAPPVPVPVPVPEPVPTAKPCQVRVSYNPPAISLTQGQIVKVQAIANNAGAGDATGEVVKLGLPSEIEVVESAAAYDVDADRWVVGNLPANTQKAIDVSLRVKP